ncbi:MAG: SDR family NAD(P)-dependent oxidoreductase, partial [Clostridia bacterium]|nr:SDR family NAD(P)-dependent oxidoreductase [Clostridia bacterium]
MPNVFVTGASGVIGHGIALEYAKKGYDVAVHYNRTAEPAEELAREIEALGRKAVLIRGDISSVEEIER